MDLGFQLVKTKGDNWWHRKDDPNGISYAGDSDDEEDDDKSKVTAEKTAYPTLAIDDCPKELFDAPEEAECTVSYKVKRRSMTEDEDGKPKYSVELAIMSMDPTPKPAKSNRVNPLDRTKKAMEEYKRDYAKK